MIIPAYAFRNTVSVEPLLGNYAHGPSYGPAVTYKCYVEDGYTMVLSKEGKEVVSSSRVYMPPGAVIPVESRVTVNNRETIVLDVKVLNGAGMPTPDHIEVILR